MTSDPRNQIADLERQISHLKKQLEQEQATGPHIADFLASAQDRGIHLLALPCTDLLQQLAKNSEYSRSDVKRVTALCAMAAAMARRSIPIGASRG